MTPWAVAYHAPLSLGFSRQEYWSGLPFPSPEDLPHSGIKPGSPALQTDSLPTESPGKSFLYNQHSVKVVKQTSFSQWRLYEGRKVGKEKQK